MGKDIKKYKEMGTLKRVFISVGGQNNTYDPDITKLEELSQSCVNLLNTLNADGIDFDLEHMGLVSQIGEEAVGKFTTDFIKRMKELK